MADNEENSENNEEKIFYFFFRGLEDEIHCVRLFDGMLFGRREDCDVVLDDDLISGQHFQVHLAGRYVYVEDLDSVNKTFVNDEFLDPLRKRKLSVGDIVRVGSEIYGFSESKVLSFNLPKRPNSDTRITTSINKPSGIGLDMSGTHLGDKKSDSKKILSQMTECKKKIKAYEQEKQDLIDSKKLLQEHKEDMEDLEIQKQRILKDFPSIDESKFKEAQKMFEDSEKNIESIIQDTKDAEDEIDRLHQKIEENEVALKLAKEKKENMQYEMGVYSRFADLQKSIDNLKTRMEEMKNPTEKIKKLEQMIRQEKSNHKDLQKEYGEAVVVTSQNRPKKPSR